MVYLGMSLVCFMFSLENTYLGLKPLQNYPKVIVIVIKAQVHFLEIQTILYRGYISVIYHCLTPKSWKFKLYMFLIIRFLAVDFKMKVNVAVPVLT